MTAAQPARPPLFRPEVAERNWELLASRGLMPRAPRFTTAAIVLLLVAFAAGGTFLVRGVIPRVETAQGYLEPAGGVARVRAPRQAIVETIHVKDGQLVQRGDSLITLQSGQTTESGATAGGRDRRPAARPAPGSGDTDRSGPGLAARRGTPAEGHGRLI